MKRTTVLTNRVLRVRSLTRTTPVLLSLTLMAALAYSPANSQSATRPEELNVAPGASSLPDSTPPAARPLPSGSYAVTSADTPADAGPYFCEEESARNAPVSEVTLEFTRQQPRGGWLGTLRSKHRDGRVVEQAMQLFAPKAVPTGTEWSYQTTDGKIRCKLLILSDKRELRFADCNNRVQQYCLAQSYLRLTEDKIPECKEKCGRLPFLEQPSCYAECAAGVVRRAGELLDCSGLRILRCWATSLLIWIARREGPDAVTRAGLDELYLNWVNFVNRSHGFGRGGNSCAGRAYLCPGGTQCIGDTCKVVKPRN